MTYKVTKEYLESQIKDVQYIETVPNKCVNCVITVKNGYTFQGEAGVIDPDNFNIEIGKKVAYENAFNKMWLVFGYQVQEKYYREKVLNWKELDRIKISELDEEISKLNKICKSLDHNELLYKEFEILKAHKHILQERIDTLK